MKTLAVAICAPSGAGKTTVAQALVSGNEELRFSVSATTRAARADEIDGVDYHFVGRDEFETMIRDGRLLEWAEVHGELYGTPHANLADAERQGKVLILDIDVQGARQVLKELPDTATIFLLPPSFEVLQLRLRSRGSEDAARLRRRMETARNELRSVEEFEYVVVNDRLDHTVAAIRSIIAAEGQRLSRGSAAIDELRRRLQEDLERALA